MDIEVKDLKNLIAIIKERHNFDFSNYAMSSFKRRVDRVMQLYNFNTIEDLIQKLNKEKPFYEKFLKEITVNTTEMFRDPSLWRKLKNEIMPILSGNQNIRIWHAACSSGEEVYSMAILLKELNLLERAIIYATDINEDVLETAKSGLYNSRNMEINQSNFERFGSNNKLSDYYEVVDDKVKFDTNLIKNVKFTIHDLVNGTSFHKFDLILCRNVMIYFNLTLQDRAVSLFHESLFNNSFLAVGSKETIAWCKTADKFSTYCADEKIYRKIKD